MEKSQLHDFDFQLSRFNIKLENLAKNRKACRGLLQDEEHYSDKVKKCHTMLSIELSSVLDQKNKLTDELHHRKQHLAAIDNRVTSVRSYVADKFSALQREAEENKCQIEKSALDNDIRTELKTLCKAKRMKLLSVSQSHMEGFILIRGRLKRFNLQISQQEGPNIAEQFETFINDDL